MRNMLLLRGICQLFSGFTVSFSNLFPSIYTHRHHTLHSPARIHSYSFFSCFDVHYFVWIIFNSIRIMHSFQMHRDNSGISIAATVKHFKCVDLNQFVVLIACQHQCIAGFIFWSIQRISFSFCHFAHKWKWSK